MSLSGASGGLHSCGKVSRPAHLAHPRSLGPDACISRILVLPALASFIGLISTAVGDNKCIVLRDR